MTFWGGHYQIPEKDEIDDMCFTSWQDSLVVLLETHPPISTIGNSVVKLQACILNHDRECDSTVQIETINCQGDILYRFPWVHSSDQDIWIGYICFDRIYEDTCSDTSMQYSAGTVEDNIIHFEDGDIKTGWLKGMAAGKQFVFPSIADLDIFAEKCFNGGGYVLQEPAPTAISETPTRLALCYVYNDYFYDYNNNDNEYNIYHDGNGNCNYFQYTRTCNGKLQFDLSFIKHWWHGSVCLIHKTNVFVRPEIRHDVNIIEVDGKLIKEFSPALQYRCSFNMTEGVSYITNWYINGSLIKEKGPSSSLDNLVFDEDILNDFPTGYEVQCGVFSVADSLSNESLSDVFFAGWKVSENTIRLRKSGYAKVKLELTIPYGCSYTDDEEPQCTEILSSVAASYNPNVCEGSIRTQDVDHPGNSFIEVQSLKKGEQWSSKTYKLKFTTFDVTYDDKTEYDLELSLTRNTGQMHRREVRNEIVGNIHVSVTDFNRHWNKRCYSHVDPHHRTQDGQNFEMQREGDHMLYLNKEYQTEIQQSARYCTPGYTRGPVCACGIAIRVGADVFVINRCHDSDFTFDYEKCGDGGLIDIEKINDFRYMVTTPTGTKVDIFLLNWHKTMNIDVYMSAKDFGNVVGLCGYFDGDRSNDLVHRDNTTVSDDSNRSYMFSDSWILTDEENLFKNKNRILEPWNPENAGGTGNSCRRPRSITKKKCRLPQRKKRSLLYSKEKRNEQKQHQETLISATRTKRSVVSFTSDEAFEFCNHSVYTSPAVLEFPDKLAEENPDVVVEQCVYDLTQGNDTSWVDAHIASLNAAVDTILHLNPVFVANNSEAVKKFLSKTCLNNCSQDGVCSDTGSCQCNGDYRGPDCSYDIKIPPIVYEVHGGDICDPGDGDDCTCFQIRTENVFEGFMCDMRKYKVYFNGTYNLVKTEVFEGEYHDIFTGVCCDTADRKKRSSDEDDISVTMYVFNVSNDGTNYGDPNTVYVYDTACIVQTDINGIVTFELKNDFCFIDDVCVIENTKVVMDDGCYFCDPSENPLRWTEGNCEVSNSSAMKSAMLAGIIVGSICAVIVVSVLFYIVCLKKTKKQRAIQDSHTNLRNMPANLNFSLFSNTAGSSTCTKSGRRGFEGMFQGENGTSTNFPYPILTNVAKPDFGLDSSRTAVALKVVDLDSVVESTNDDQDVQSGRMFKSDKPAIDPRSRRLSRGNVTPISVSSLELY